MFEEVSRTQAVSQASRSLRRLTCLIRASPSVRNLKGKSPLSPRQLVHDYTRHLIKQSVASYTRIIYDIPKRCRISTFYSKKKFAVRCSVADGSDAKEEVLETWQALCLQHAEEIRPRLHEGICGREMKASAYTDMKAMLGDKLLDTYLVLRMLADYENEEDEQFWTKGKYTLSRNYLLSNRHLHSCGKTLMVPELFTCEEWEEMPSIKQGGTAFEATVGELYELEENSGRFTAAMDEVIKFLLSQAPVISRKHPKMFLLEQGGTVSAINANAGGYVAVAHLEGVRAESIGAFASKKGAELSAALEVLTEKGFSEYDDWIIPCDPIRVVSESVDDSE